MMAKLLEDEIGELEKLNEIRKKAVLLRDDGIKVLNGLEYQVLTRNLNLKKPKPTTLENWDYPGDDVEKALLFGVLNGSASGEYGAQTQKDLDRDLRRTTLSDCYTEAPLGSQSSFDHVPLLRVSRVMHALLSNQPPILDEATLS